MKKVWVLGLLAMAVGCSYVGQEGATLEQQFYEVDQVAIGVLESSTISLRAIHSQGVVVPEEVRVSLGAQAMVLRETRMQVRSWIDACGNGEESCPPEERIRLGIDTVIASTSMVRSILKEVSSYGY